MKILLYLPTPGGLTGAPRRLLTLAVSLREQGLTVCILSDLDSELKNKAEELGFETKVFHPFDVLSLRGGALFGGGVFFRFRTGLALILQNLKFWKLVRESRVEIVWIRASKGMAFAGLGALLSGRPLVWDIDYELPSKGMIKWLHVYGLWVSSVVAFQYVAAPHLIFGAELTQRYGSRFHSLIPGINTATLDPFVTMNRKELRTPRSFVLLQVGTICDRKNQMLLLEALGRLRQNTFFKDIKVLLAGGVSDVQYVGLIRHKIADLGFENTVKLLGWRNDVHKLMVEADLLVMPSKDEGVPNTVQEAMYIGLPVLVSNIGGMPEIVQHGKTGWVLPLEKTDEWASQINRCINDEDGCSRIGQAASVYAAKNFDMEEWARKYVGIIREVAKAHSK